MDKNTYIELIKDFLPNIVYIDCDLYESIESIGFYDEIEGGRKIYSKWCRIIWETSDVYLMNCDPTLHETYILTDDEKESILLDFADKITTSDWNSYFKTIHGKEMSDWSNFNYRVVIDSDKSTLVAEGEVSESY